MRQSIFSALLFSLFLIGCAPCIPFFSNEFDIGKSKEITVGTSMMSWSEGMECFNTTSPGKSRDGIEHELIYCGIANNVIAVQYREYSILTTGTYARQSYYLDLKYDISDSCRTISYQRVRIRIDTINCQRMICTILQGPKEIEPIDTVGKVGIHFNSDGLITQVIEGMPAARAGIKVGDRLLMINGEDIPLDDHDAVMAKLAGKPGTDVYLTLRRGVGLFKDNYKLTRQKP